MGKVSRAKVKALQLEMSKNGNRVPAYEAKRKLVEQQEGVGKTNVALTLGQHRFRLMEGPDAVFGAKRSDYPAMADVPRAHQSMSSIHQTAAVGIFHRGGRLADFGLKWRDRSNSQNMLVLSALLCSFEPPHEQKIAVVAWFLAEHTEAIQ